MATIYNSELSKEIQEGGKLQIRDKMPNELAEKVVPVMEVNPKLLMRSKCLYGAEVTATTGASPGTVIYTCNSSKKVLITGISYSFIANAACDNITCRIRMTSNGQATYPITIFKPTLTAVFEQENIVFPFPLELDKGSTIHHFNVFTAGSCTTNIAIFGYEQDNALA
jgi:hypothetical protein